MQLTLEEAREYLRYEPETGNFYWIKNRSNWRGYGEIGQLAGGVNAIGYWQIGFGRTRFDKRRILGHRLAWLFAYGRWPKRIDHINGNRSDNRLCNLRECGQSENLGNADYGPMRGIEHHGAKWRVRIHKIGQKRIEIGSFATLEQAIAARDDAYNQHFGEHSYFNREKGETPC